MLPVSDLIQITRRQFGKLARLRSQKKHKIQVKTRFHGYVLEMEDANFHHDSAVLLPDYGPQAPQPGTEAQNRITGLAVLDACYSHAEAHPAQLVLVVGHTDRSGSETYNQTLSELRADNVRYALQGNRAQWVDIAHRKHKVEDYQQILSWLTHSVGWHCDPGAKDNVLGPKTQQAVRDFQTQYNEKHGGTLTVTGAVDRATWGAFFDVYMHTLMRIRGTNAAGLAAARTALHFLPCQAIGCGEGFPITSNRKENYRSAVDRRVEILFFDRGEEPLLDCAAPHGACEELYKKKMYTFKPIPAQPKPVATGLEILTIDPHFAPSVENLDLTYRIKGLAAQSVKFQVLDAQDVVLYERFLSAAEKADGTGKPLTWDGKANQGTFSGRFVTPLSGPFKARLAAGSGEKEERPFNVLYHSIVLHHGKHTPDGALPPVGERNKYAQARLNALGYDAGPVNGTIGDVTQRALRRFQRANHRVGTQTLLTENGTLDDPTFAALQNAALAAREQWEAGKDPLTQDSKYYVYDNYYSDRGADFVTSNIPEFNSMNRKLHVEDKLDRPYIPLEVEIKLLKKDNTGAAAPEAVGPVPVAWEVVDGPEDAGIISAATNATAHTYVERARQFGTTAHVTGAPRIDQTGDNAPKSLEGFREQAAADNIKAWFPSDAASRLAPFTILRYATENRAGVVHHRALVAAWDHPTDHPARKGRAGVYFRFSTKGGDDARIRVSLSFDGLGNKARLEQAHQPRAADLVKETGRWTVWRRMRVSAYCQQRPPTRASGNPTWATIRDWWKEAFLEVENNGQPLQPNVNYATVVTEAVYKNAILTMPATHRPAGVSTAAHLTYRAQGIYGGPPINQAPGEAPGDYLRRARNAMIAWIGHPLNAVLDVIHDHVRKTSPEGLIIFDYSVYHQALTGQVWNAATASWSPSPNPAHANFWVSHRGYVRLGGAVTMDVHNPFDVDCYVLHECGHARFLYHHHTGGGSAGGGSSDTPTHHDADQERCAMSYNIRPDGPGQWRYPFCGKCLLRLRGWKVTTLPNKYTT